tara:strand:- start:77552 stop:77875 length:324 start_codon:yes stop_codon:yes gene_type:complete
MGYVYFIDDDTGRTKIGRTRKHPNERLKQFQFPNLSLRCFFETRWDSKLEVALHSRYKFCSESREWFNLEEFSTEELIKTCEILNDSISTIFNNDSDIQRINCLKNK